MTRRYRTFARLLALAALILLAARPGAAQEPSPPGRGQTLPDTLEAIQQAQVVTRVLFIVAHPDDEASTLLTYLSHGLGSDVTLLTLTRGEGGQNAIGPEQGPRLAVLRSHELSRAMEFEGPRLLFTRASDFGFSKTLEETLEMWKGVTLPDMVRVIRTVRPHIVVNGWGNGTTGHGNHQASGYLTPRAVAAAADPAQFPEQFADGLKPWRVDVVMDPVRARRRDEKVDFSGSWVVPADEISPIWGRSYRDISLEGYLQHHSQGLNPNSPFVRRPYGLKRATGGAPAPGDFAQPLGSLVERMPVPAARPLAAARHALELARAAAEEIDWPGAAMRLAEAGKQIAELQVRVKSSGDGRAADALWELEQVRERIDHALADASAIKIHSNSDRSELVAGEGFSVRVELEHRADVPLSISKPGLLLPSGWTITKQEEKEGVTTFTVAVPAGAQTPHTPGDWMLPFPPPLVRARVAVEVDGYSFEFAAPVESGQVTSTTALIFPLRLVPAISLTLEPEQFVVVEGRQPRQFELFARVHSFAHAPASVSVGVNAPAGWKAPEAQPVEFSGAGDQLVRMVSPRRQKFPPANMN